MSRTRNFIATAAIGAAVALPLLAAEKLAAKAGLWETTTTTNVGGMPTIPPEMLANLSASQRAQVELAMAAASGKPVTGRSCVTEQDLVDGFLFSQYQPQNVQCTFTVTSGTPKRQEATIQCTSPAGPADGKMVVDVVSDTHVNGTMQVKSPQMSVDMKFEAKWIGASCGATK
jgi:hypothetical protein